MEDFEKTKGTTRKTYICKDCRERVRLTHKPSFCPTCGSANIKQDTEKAEAYIAESLKRLEEYIQEMDQKWDEYALVHARYERTVRSLSTYTRRHLLAKSDIPKPHKISLSEALKKYREDINNSSN